MKRPLLGVPLLILGCRASSAPTPPAVTLALPPADSLATQPGPSAPAPVVQRDPWLYAPQPLQGPYPSLDAYCQALARPDPEGDVTAACAPPDRTPSEGSFTLAAPSGPYEGARIVFTHDPTAAAPMVDCRVALRTAGAWYVSGSTLSCRGVFATSGHLQVSAKQLAVEDLVMGGAPVLVFRYVEHQTMTSMDRGPGGRRIDSTLRRNQEGFIVCGLGASRWPSCTPALPVVHESLGGDTVRIRWSSTAPGGLSATASGDLDAVDLEPKALLGFHPVVFP
jgi:hypothetical protein